MSFTTSIAGNPPPNAFVYTTTHVSVDSISVNNLSATNASIVNLTTVVFSPINVNSSVIVANLAEIITINCSTLNSSLVACNDIVANSGTINVFNSGYITTTDLEALDINVSTILADDIGTNTFNAVAGEAVTFNTSTSNCSQLNVSNVSATIIQVPTLKTTNISCTNISGTNATCTNIWSSFQETTFVFFSDQATNGAGAIRKNASALYIDSGGYGTAGTAPLLFSIDKVNYNMSYDGDLNLSTTANLSVINSANISANNINASTIGVSTINCKTSNVSTVNGSVANFPILNTTTINTHYANSIVYNTSTLNASEVYVDGLITTFGNMSCVALQGDISQNLVAGTNITLTTTNGITTINSSGGGGSVDPLNISVGNISILNTSNSTCDGTLTTSNLITGNLTAFDSNMSYLNVSTIYADNINGFIKSTQYAFQTTSNAGSIAFSTGALLPFNVIEFCVPSITAFNTTASNYSYTVQVAGLYSFGFHLYLTNPSADTGFEIALFKNNVKFASGGSKAGFTEDVECLAQCVIGDIWTVKIVTVSGSPQIFMSQTNSWMYGYLLEPTNVAINTGTDLTVASLNTSTANVSNINVSTANVSDINVSHANVSDINVSHMDADGANFQSFTTSFALINSDTGSAPAVLKKVADNVRLYAGNTTTPGTISFSQDNVTYPLLFNGNLNLATTFNSSNANISQCFSNIASCNLLETPLINCSTSNMSMVNSSNANISAVTSAITYSRFLSIPSTTPTVVNDALLYKYIAELRICGGDTPTPGNITFSQDNVSRPMVFDGNLNIATIANISTTNTSTLNVSAFGATNNLVGKSSIYSRYTSAQVQPGSVTTYYHHFQSERYANTDLFTYVTPTNGSANQGFICQKAGFYKIDYSIICFSVNYQNRVQWYVRPTLNNVVQVGRSWGYSRAGVLGSGYVWSCNCTATIVLEMAVNDYFSFYLQVAKNDTSVGDDFNSLGLDAGSVCTMQYLGT